MRNLDVVLLQLGACVLGSSLKLKSSEQGVVLAHISQTLTFLTEFSGTPLHSCFFIYCMPLGLFLETLNVVVLKEAVLPVSLESRSTEPLSCHVVVLPF